MNVGGAASAANAQVGSEVSLAVLKQSQQAQKLEGEAAVALLDQAKETAQQQIDGGEQLDVRV